MNTLGYQADLSCNVALCFYKLKRYGEALKHIAEIIERGVCGVPSPPLSEAGHCLPMPPSMFSGMRVLAKSISGLLGRNLTSIFLSIPTYESIYLNAALHTHLSLTGFPRDLSLGERASGVECGIKHRRHRRAKVDAATTCDRVMASSRG